MPQDRSYQETKSMKNECKQLFSPIMSIGAKTSEIMVK